MGTSAGVELPVLKRSAASVSRSTDANKNEEYAQLYVPAERFAESIRLDVDSLIQEVFRHIEHELGQSVDKFFQDQIQQLPMRRCADRRKASRP